MIIKTVTKIIALLGNFIGVIAAAIVRPALLAKINMETEIAEGKIRCHHCGSSDLAVKIVPYKGQYLVVAGHNPTEEFSCGSTETIQTVCNKCGTEI